MTTDGIAIVTAIVADEMAPETVAVVAAPVDTEIITTGTETPTGAGTAR